MEGAAAAVGAAAAAKVAAEAAVEVADGTQPAIGNPRGVDVASVKHHASLVTVCGRHHREWRRQR